MNVVDTKGVGSYANYQIGYDLIGTNNEQGYHTIRCYGVFNVTGNNWSAYNIKASVAGQENSLGYQSYGRGSYTLVSKDVNVYATNEGKCSYSFGGQLTSGYQSSSWASGTAYLPDIPRSSIPTINNQTTNQPNFNIGETIRIYTNRKSTSFTHKVYFNYGGTELEIATGITDYYDYDTSTIANALYALIPTEKSYAGTITLKTYSGTTQIGTAKSCNYVANVVNSDPIFTDFDFADTNSATNTLTGNNKYNVNNYSNITATISTSNKASAINGAEMVMYRFVIGNDSVDIPYSSSANVSGTINKAVTGIYTVYAIDSRGNSTAVTKQATSIINYTELVRTTNPSSKRNTGVGEEYTLNYAGNLWNQSFGSVTNTIVSATYRYKKSTSSTWINGTTNIMPTVSNDTFSFTGLIKGDTNAGFDINDSYNIEVTVADKLSTVTYTVLLINGRPNIAVAKDGVSIGAKYDTDVGGALQVNGDFYLGNANGASQVNAGNVIRKNEEHILYDNEYGSSATTIQLSRDWVNYSKIAIVYSRGHICYIDTDYYTGSSIDLSYFWNDGTSGAGIFGAFYTLNNNSELEYQYARRFYFYTHNTQPTIDTTDNVYVYKVIGYK